MAAEILPWSQDGSSCGGGNPHWSGSRYVSCCFRLASSDADFTEPEPGIDEQGVVTVVSRNQRFPREERVSACPQNGRLDVTLYVRQAKP